MSRPEDGSGCVGCMDAECPVQNIIARAWEYIGKAETDVEMAVSSYLRYRLALLSLADMLRMMDMAADSLRLIEAALDHPEVMRDESTVEQLTTLAAQERGYRRQR